MSRSVVSTKIRRLADHQARERIGIGAESIAHQQPRIKREYRQELAASIRNLTSGATYYTTRNFPAF